MNDRTEKLIVITSAILGAFIVGYITGECRIRQSAVDSKAAIWTVDNRGNVGFRWLNSRNKIVEDREQTK